MNTSELAFANKVRRALNQNLDLLPKTAVDRLVAARRTAICHKKKDTPLHIWLNQNVLAGHIGQFFSDALPRTGWLGVAVPVMVVAIGLVFSYQSELRQLVNNDAEIEAQILADDLPLIAYLDNGFKTYLDEQQN